MNKLITLYDGLDATDKLNYSTFKTSVDVLNAETGEIIFKGLKNKVIIPGSGLIARKLFDVTTEEITPSYNEVFGESMYTPATDEAPDSTELETVATKDNHKVLLFCCGIDGCGTQNSQVYPVDYRKWIAPEDLVPFRCVPTDNDINDELRKSYFGRTEVEIKGNKYIAYYFKRFQSVPTLVQQFIDGTPVTKDIYDAESDTAAESYVEMNLKITTQDIRDFFAASTGMDDARINSISLCSAYPVTDVDGYTYFKDIRPVTKLNFPNEQFIDASKGIDIIYHIYM